MRSATNASTSFFCIQEYPKVHQCLSPISSDSVVPFEDPQHSVLFHYMLSFTIIAVSANRQLPDKSEMLYKNP